MDAIQLNHTKRIDAGLTLKESTAISRKIVKDSAGKIMILTRDSVVSLFAVVLSPIFLSLFVIFVCFVLVKYFCAVMSRLFHFCLILFCEVRALFGQVLDD